MKKIFSNHEIPLIFTRVVIAMAPWRKKQSHIFISVLILCNLVVTNFSFSQEWENALKDALKGIMMEPSDLHFQTDQIDMDPFRLSHVDRLMKDPLLSLEDSRSLGQTLLQEDASLSSLLVKSAQELDIEISPSSLPRSKSPQEVDFQRIVNILKDAIQKSSPLVNEAFQFLKPEEVRFLQQNLPELLEEDLERAEKNPYEKWIEEQEIEGKTERFLEIVQRYHQKKMVQAGFILFSALDNILPHLKEIESSLSNREIGKVKNPIAEGDVLYYERTPFGDVVVGGYGETVYTGDALLILDLGGEDRYEMRAGGVVGGGDRSISIVIDQKGDDQYLYRGDCAQGSGWFGIGILIDMEGDDYYSAHHYSQGSGMMGIGLLLDLSGNDRYSGDTGTQGAGAFGIGFLRDHSGNDLYSSHFLSQGFGFTSGFGSIADLEGNDLYFAGGKYRDWLRYEDHFLSLSQGFGYGIRPFASGGIGILADGKGNDTYISDIFGQGSSYWFSLGSLVDLQGNDKYSSYQYAQGCGTHLTIGTLLDLEGNDDYVSKGVSQGCGHDLSLGLLYDEKGNDNYSAYDLSQGAGNANGIGILMDREGKDNYLVRDPLNTHGYGNFRREYGSIGLFLDLGGEDGYSGYGGDNGYWGGSKYGIGVDKGNEK